jgi:hypothetical protein
MTKFSADMPQVVTADPTIFDRLRSRPAYLKANADVLSIDVTHMLVLPAQGVLLTWWCLTIASVKSTALCSCKHHHTDYMWPCHAAGVCCSCGGAQQV